MVVPFLLRVVRRRETNELLKHGRFIQREGQPYQCLEGCHKPFHGYEPRPFRRPIGTQQGLLHVLHPASRHPSSMWQVQASPTNIKQSPHPRLFRFVFLVKPHAAISIIFYRDSRGYHHRESPRRGAAGKALHGIASNVSAWEICRKYNFRTRYVQHCSCRRLSFLGVTATATWDRRSVFGGGSALWASGDIRGTPPGLLLIGGCVDEGGPSHSGASAMVALGWALVTRPVLIGHIIVL